MSVFHRIDASETTFSLAQRAVAFVTRTWLCSRGGHVFVHTEHGMNIKADWHHFRCMGCGRLLPPMVNSNYVAAYNREGLKVKDE